MSHSSLQKKLLQQNHFSPQYSGYYEGQVIHTRFEPKKHAFSYKLAMLILDLDELAKMDFGRLFSWNKSALLRFNAKDYLAKIPTSKSSKQHNPVLELKQKVLNKVNEMQKEKQQENNPFENNLNTACDRVIFAGQIRHFGFYFSPINFFFCYQNKTAKFMLAEVSNTPWNERHYYLVDINNALDTPKAFHVSPFMDLNMHYKWKINPPDNKLTIAIDNYNPKRIFSAGLSLSRKEFNHNNLKLMLYRFPLMTIKIILGIYWQALKLFIKGIPFVSHK